MILTVALICLASAANRFGQDPVEPVAGPKPVAIKIFEIDNVSRREFRKQWNRENWAFSDWKTPLYIINYGADKEIAWREKVIVDSIALRNFDRVRITLVRGGTGDAANTMVWKVPYGADNPSP